MAAITGGIAGFLDVITMLFVAPASPEGTIPASFWVSVPVTWITLCVFVAFVFSLPELRRLAFVAVIFAAASVLLFSRVAPLFYEAFGLPLRLLAVATAVVAAVLCAICSYLLIKKATITITYRLTLAKSATAVALAISCAGMLVPKPVLSSGATNRSSAQPNIVLVFLDTLREDDRRSDMPALDRFSHDSVVFDNAWAPAPWTVPSHLAVLSGRNGWQARDHASTLATVLHRSGYSTWAIFANPTLGSEPDIAHGYSHLVVSDSSGVAQSGIGFLLSRSHMYGGPRFPGFAWMSGPEVTAEFGRVIRRARRPYFITLNYMDAHFPYYVLAQCRDASFRRPSLAQLGKFRGGVTGGIHLSESTATAIRSEYQDAIRCMDRSIDLLVRTIEAQPDAARTVVVFVGDHGEQFGEHGFTMHGNSLYRPVLHVPLIVHVPGVPAARVDDPISITDLHDTLAKIVFSGMASASGSPLLNRASRSPVVAELVMGSQHSVGIADSTYHLIRSDSGKEEWYAYTSDPAESHPLPQPQTAAAALLRRRLMEEFQFAIQTSKPFRALGYIQ